MTNYSFRYASHPNDAKNYTTERIREEFLIENLFQKMKLIWYIQCMID